MQGYKDEMLNPEMQPLIPINLYGKSDLLFGNMEEIFRFHNDVFLRDLENCIHTPELIGLCFVQRVSFFLCSSFVNYFQLSIEPYFPIFYVGRQDFSIVYDNWLHYAIWNVKDQKFVTCMVK